MRYLIVAYTIGKSWSQETGGARRRVVHLRHSTKSNGFRIPSLSGKNGLDKCSPTHYQDVVSLLLRVIRK